MAAVLYAGLCKALLFHNLEYPHGDFFSSLEMTWSWLFTGRLLHDNTFGDHSALHNFYLLPAFAPLTLAFGAYGLVTGLVVLNALAALRASGATTLDAPGRLAVLSGLLSPLAYFIFDHPRYGFHPELCYFPLAVLLAFDLAEARTARAALVAGLIILVKEDGAVLCAAVLVAFFAGCLWAVRRGPRGERRRVLLSAALSLLAMIVVFAAGMTLLWIAGRGLDGTQPLSSVRLSDSIGVLGRTLAGRRRSFVENLEIGLLSYGVLAAVVLLPLGRRLGRGVILLLLASPVLVAVLVVSSAGYGFAYLLWAPRLATFLALVLACVVLASCREGPPAGLRPRRALAVTGALAAASWILELVLLSRAGYSPWPRLDLLALLDGRRYAGAALPAAEIAFHRCLARSLPRGLPVLSQSGAYPAFHHQSIVFEGFEAQAMRAPRLRVLRLPPSAPPPPAGTCRGPQMGPLVVEADCDLVPIVAHCGL